MTGPKTLVQISSNWGNVVHLDQARLALLNCFHAEKNKGKVIGLCNDFVYKKTDKFESDTVMSCLQWLGVKLDSGLYYMSHFKDEYKRAIKTLVDSSFAYYDYKTPSELQISYINDTPLRNQRRNYRSGGVVRLAMPRVKRPYYVYCQDALKGEIKIDLSLEQDPIIVDENGIPSLDLISVVNDNQFKIDFKYVDISNFNRLPVQARLAEFLKIKLPTFAHIGYLSEPHKVGRLKDSNLEEQLKTNEFAKLYNKSIQIFKYLSHGRHVGLHPSQLNFYRVLGFSPAALRHYLLATIYKTHSFLRACVPVNKQRIVNDYNLNQISRISDKFDICKLMKIQRTYFVHIKPEELTKTTQNIFYHADMIDDPYTISPQLTIKEIVNMYRHRLDFTAELILLAKDFDPKVIKIKEKFLEMLGSADEQSPV